MLAAALAFAIALNQMVFPSTGTAVMSGRVTDKASGAPIANAVVSLRNARGSYATQTLTDARGRFQFPEVPADQYALRAVAGLYRSTHIATNYPEGESSPLLVVKPGEERTDIVIALPRALAINGRVTDEAGNPLAQIVISLSAGRGTTGMSSRQRMTDDRGVFRLHGLSPGRYTVCADVRERGPSFEPPPQRRLHYLRSCYGEPQNGTELVLTEVDVEGVEIRLPRRQGFVVSGIVATPDGAPPVNATVMLMRFMKNGGTGTSSRLADHGVFTVSDVVPGTYEISARLGRDQRSNQDDERDPQWGAVRFDVTTADVEGLVVVIKPAATVKGRVVFEDPPQAGSTQRMTVGAMPTSSTFGWFNTSPVPVAADGTFELKNLFGAVVVQPQGQPPRGYVLKSVLYRGRDIVDIATEFDGNPAHELQVEFTSRTAELSGQVFDDSGNPVAQATIVRFPAEAARWKRLTGFLSGSTLRNGSYRLSMLPAGDYFVVAVPSGALRELTFPDDFERLAQVAERITLLENDRRTADLRLTSIPPRKKR